MTVNCAFYGDSPPDVCRKVPEAKKRTVSVVGYNEDFGDVTEDVWLPIIEKWKKGKAKYEIS